ncbi:hypothetical protein DFR29_10582 [Tahibacter aquaticus]|uniref:Uncharacterized protein n=1 Tax=Tahibacter aquaticus TaxID=520092 RepID=A0A4R6Z0J8_9GAMM|nr:hypothetical protein [Tahibacter aquaticus]TDR44899.1 hypothetical protein DFR29_10582 [Tahibacter aquaticus]
MRLFLALLFLCVAMPASAYIGPGAGVSFFGSLWAILVGIVISLIAVLAWPVRWFWRRLRRRQQQAAAATASSKDPA